MLADRMEEWLIAKKFAVCFALALLLLTACSSGTVDWDGTYYYYIDDSTVKAITIETRNSDTLYIEVADVSVQEGGGYGLGSTSGYAEITGKNTAEDWRCRYTLNGDNLTVRVQNDGYEPKYNGKYERGGPIDETFGAGESESPDAALEDEAEDEAGDEFGTVDEWAPDDSADGSVYSAPAGTPLILTGSDTYYEMLDGGLEMTLGFRDGGVTIFVSDTGLISAREYEIGDGCIFVKLEDEDMDGSDYAHIVPLQFIEILDLCTLRDVDDNIYAIKDSQGLELVTNTFYYLNNDYYSPKFWFFDDGTVDIDNVGEETIGCAYEVEGSMIYIDIEGEPVVLEIVNKRVLQADDGSIYFRPLP